MDLIRLGKSRWDVVALCNERGSCPLLDFLEDLDPSLKSLRNRMLGLLREYVTQHGPPRSKERCRHLNDHIWEFKIGQLRALWFYHQDRMIVCTHGFMKRTRKTPRREIQRAKRLRKQYLASVRSGNLMVLTRTSHQSRGGRGTAASHLTEPASLRSLGLLDVLQRIRLRGPLSQATVIFAASRRELVRNAG